MGAYVKPREMAKWPRASMSGPMGEVKKDGGCDTNDAERGCQGFGITKVVRGNLQTNNSPPYTMTSMLQILLMAVSVVRDAFGGAISGESFSFTSDDDFKGVREAACRRKLFLIC